MGTNLTSRIEANAMLPASVRGKNCQFKLLESLGAGKYSEVWKACSPDYEDQYFAVKIQHSGLGSAEKTVFEREIYHLRGLESGQIELKFQVAGQFLTPLLVAVNLEHDPPFFVQSFAAGKPVDLLLREDGYLSEPDALILGEQLCRVFLALHEKLNRSYLDFQPRNVFWDGDRRRIVVVDWNLLGPEGQVDVRADIQAITRLIYRLLLGQAVPESVERHPERLKTLSTGAQTLALRLANPNWYTALRGLREELLKLVGWWNADILPAEIVSQAQSAVSGLPAYSPDLRDLRDMLSIALIRGADPQPSRDLLALVEKKIEEFGDLARGEKAYLIGENQAAQEALDRILQQEYSLANRLAACRLQEALRLHTTEREWVVEWLRRLNTWTRSYQEIGFDPIIVHGEKEGRALPDAIVSEWRVWYALKKIAASHSDDIADMDESLKSYQKVLDSIQAIPYGELLADLFGGLPKIKLDQQALQRRAEQRKLDLANKRTLLASLNSSPPGDLHGLVKEDPELTYLVLDKARTRWKEENYDLALKLLTDIEQDAAIGCAAELDGFKRTIINSLVWHYRLVQIQEEVYKLIQPSAEDGHQAQDEVFPPGNAVWVKLIVLVQALLNEDTNEEPARKQAWRIVHSAINWLGLPEEYLKDISDLGTQLIQSPEPVEKALKARRDYMAQLQKDQEVLLKQQEMQTCITDARSSFTQALSDAISRMKRAKELSEQLSELIGKSDQPTWIGGWIIFYENVNKSLQGYDIVEAIKRLKADAESKRLLVKHIHEAVISYDQALQLVKALPAQESTRFSDLPNDRKYSYEFYDTVKNKWQDHLKNVQNQQWDKARASLASLRSLTLPKSSLKLQGVDHPGDFDAQVDMIDFEARASEFRSLCQRWESQLQDRPRLVDQDMPAAIAKLERLVKSLDETYVQRLVAIKDQQSNYLYRTKQSME